VRTVCAGQEIGPNSKRTKLHIFKTFVSLSFADMVNSLSTYTFNLSSRDTLPSFGGLGSRVFHEMRSAILAITWIPEATKDYANRPKLKSHYQLRTLSTPRL
jgi:hypothetical protein